MPSIAKDSRVVIVGGGVGGLTLANLLQQEGFEKITVLEKWREVKTRGGHISIMPEAMGGALPVMETLGLKDRLDDFQPSAWNFRQHFNGKEYANTELPMGPRIMRQSLQQMLLEKLKPGTVQFGRGVKRFEEQEDGVNIIFEDDTAETFDFAVASDGINSTIAAQLFPDFGKKFSGFVTYMCLAHGEFLTDALYSNHISGEGRGVSIGGMQGYGSDGRWDVAAFTVRSDVPVSSDWDAEGAKADFEELLEMMEKHAGGVPDSIRDIVANSDRVMRWGIYEHEPKPTWISPGGKMLLLGDAAHAMAPYLGQGAQCAMLDAQALAKEILQDQSLAEAFQAYEAHRKPICERIVSMANFRGMCATSAGIAAVYNNVTAGLFMQYAAIIQHPKAYMRNAGLTLFAILKLGSYAAEGGNWLFGVRPWRPSSIACP